MSETVNSNIEARIDTSFADKGIPVIDYEGSHYKSDFWVGQGRDYEDATERLVLADLLPAQGGRVAEIGAGFGRLADLYTGYEQIILFDYSRTLLRDAVEKWGGDQRFVFVAGNIYQLPLATGLLDSLVMVRVMHHLADVPAALHQLSRSLHAQSVAVLEYANKRNLKAIMRWLAGRQQWSPFAPEPIEFVALNFDFHPSWMEAQFRDCGFVIQKQYAVSHFRLPVLKNRVDAKQLAKWDEKLFAIGGNYPIAPSVFVQSTLSLPRERAPVSLAVDDICKLFRCPVCAAEAFSLANPTRLTCQSCQSSFNKQEGIWDFKEVVSHS